MTRVWKRGLIVVVSTVGLAACGGGGDSGGPATAVQGQGTGSAAHVNRRREWDPQTGSILGSDAPAVIFGGPRKSDGVGDAGIGVNAYLWRGALDTLKFMPLYDANPFGGTIVTDWWTPAASPSERFKATAYILGRQLRADAVRISLFRQVLQNGQWVDAPVDPAKPTELENMVLARARELRSQSAGS